MKNKFEFKKPIINPKMNGYYYLRRNRYWIINKKNEILYFGCSPQ